METITFNCRFITPAFLGGADPKGTPELRPPSIKGALRFWWRAMNGHLPLNDLQQKEVDLFGGSFKENGKEYFKKSKIILRTIMTEEIISKDLDRSMAFRYMAYGAEDRSFFDVGTQFEVQISFNENVPKRANEIREQIITSFSLLSTFGGLGAKSRNGFGAFTCDNIRQISELLNIDAIHNNDIKPLFTAFSGRTQVYQTTKAYTDYVGIIKALSIIYKDHGRKSVAKSKRQYIGAPFKDVPIPDRHSKLHLMSVIPTNSGFKGLITFMPYDYMHGHPEFSDNHYDIWEDVVFDTFNYAIYDAEFRGSRLLKTLID